MNGHTTQRRHVVNREPTFPDARVTWAARYPKLNPRIGLPCICPRIPTGFWGKCRAARYALPWEMMALTFQPQGSYVLTNDNALGL